MPSAKPKPKSKNEDEFSDLPWPGDELASRVAGEVNRTRFYESGQQSAREIEAVLSTVGRHLDSFETILDFGCGCGRILLWLEKAAATAGVHGVDIDARAIAWVQENLPYVTAKVNQTQPPLDYPDGFFDLVFNHSVFTHIDEVAQDAWLAELRRITKPGGLVLLTVHGERAYHEFEAASRSVGGAPDVVRDVLARNGIAYSSQDGWVGGPFPEGYHTTFHAPWYVFEHWGRYFEVRAFVPHGSLDLQDFVLLQRRPDEAPVPEPVAPAIDAGGAAAPAAATAAPASAALHQAEALVQSMPDIESATAYGGAAKAFRRIVLRALRHYAEHDRKVHDAMLAAIREGDNRPPELVAGLTLSESQVRLWDALRRQGERVNRLEADIWEALGKTPPPPEPPPEPTSA